MFDGITHSVFHRDSGPGVLVMHETPGMNDRCLALADRLIGTGLTSIFHCSLVSLVWTAYVGFPSDCETVPAQRAEQLEKKRPVRSPDGCGPFAGGYTTNATGGGRRHWDVPHRKPRPVGHARRVGLGAGDVRAGSSIHALVEGT